MAYIYRVLRTSGSRFNIKTILLGYRVHYYIIRTVTRYLSIDTEPRFREILKLRDMGLELLKTCTYSFCYGWTTSNIHSNTDTFGKTTKLVIKPNSTLPYNGKTYKHIFSICIDQIHTQNMIDILFEKTTTTFYRPALYYCKDIWVLMIFECNIIDISSWINGPCQ